MASVAVVGAKVYVGGALCAALAKDASYSVPQVARENYARMQNGEYDILVNCAMPSARFAAKNDPGHDFVETVQKTADLVYGWKYKKFVQISTVSSRCQLDTVYGRHKATAEKICGFDKNLICRLGPMYNQELKKGVLIDILQNKKVFVAGESRYCFSPVSFVADWIVSHLDYSGIIEVGGQNAITLKDVAEHLGKKIEFEGVIDHQEIENPAPEFPEAREVLKFFDSNLEKFKKKKKNKIWFFFFR